MQIPVRCPDLGFCKGYNGLSATQLRIQKSMPASLNRPLYSFYRIILVALIILATTSVVRLTARYDLRTSNPKDLTSTSQPGFTEHDQDEVQNQNIKSPKIYFKARTNTTVLYIRENGLSFVQTLGLRQHRTDIGFGSRLSNVRGKGLLPGVTRKYSPISSGKPMSTYNEVECMIGNTVIVIGLKGSVFSINTSSDILMTIEGSEVSTQKTHNGTSLLISSSLNSLSLFPVSQSVVHIESSTPQQNSSSAQMSLVSLRASTGSDTQLGFEISTPTTFGTYYGGSGLDSVANTSTDGTSLYICGVTTSTNFPTTAGAFQQTSQGNRDAFIAKFDANGTRQWATYYGGSGDDIALGISKAINSTIAVCGFTTTQSGFTTSNVVQPTYAGGSTDGFVATLSTSNGARIQATYIGSTQSDTLARVDMDNEGNIVTIGNTSASAVFTMTGHQKDNGGLTDAILFSLKNNLATYNWSTYYGSVAFERGLSVATAPNGNVIIAGTTTSPAVDESIAYNCNEGLERRIPPDVFIASFSKNGVRNWGRYYGGNGIEEPSDINVPSDNRIYICGRTTSVNTSEEFIAAGKVEQQDFSGGAWDGFIVLLDNNGNRTWGAYYGGSGDDRCTGLITTPSGDVFVTGMSNSPNFPLTPKEMPSNSGGYDAFLGYYKADGKLRIASLLYGGGSDDRGAGVFRLTDNTVLMAGTTFSTNLNVQGGSQQANAGVSDVFLVKFPDLSVLSVDESSETSGIFIAPNPTNDLLQISYSTDTEFIISAKVYSILGTPVLSLGETQEGSVRTIDVSTLQHGAYIVRFRTAGNRVISIPFIKQ
jgi:hypothetical protein